MDHSEARLVYLVAVEGVCEQLDDGGFTCHHVHDVMEVNHVRLVFLVEGLYVEGETHAVIWVLLDAVVDVLLVLFYQQALELVLALRSLTSGHHDTSYLIQVILRIVELHDELPTHQQLAVVRLYESLQLIRCFKHLFVEQYLWDPDSELLRCLVYEDVSDDLDALGASELFHPDAE